jgi:hypothetical protein
MRTRYAAEDSAIRLIALAKLRFGWIIGQALPYQRLGAIFLEDGATPAQLADGVKTAVLRDWLQVDCDARGNPWRMITHTEHGDQAMVTLTERGDQATGSAGGSATTRE